MFGIGMHFSVRDLLPVRAIALPGAVAQIAVATSLGIMLAMLAVIVIGKSLAAFGIMRALTVAA